MRIRQLAETTNGLQMNAVGNDRVWLITGASSGLGRNLAETALEWGQQVVVAPRGRQSLREMEREHPGEAHAARPDVRAPAGAREPAGTATEEFGRLDVV